MLRGQFMVSESHFFGYTLENASILTVYYLNMEPHGMLQTLPPTKDSSTTGGGTLVPSRPGLLAGPRNRRRLRPRQFQTKNERWANRAEAASQWRQFRGRTSRDGPRGRHGWSGGRRGPGGWKPKPAYPQIPKESSHIGHKDTKDSRYSQSMNTTFRQIHTKPYAPADQLEPPSFLKTAGL